jgi:hypothetical protein
MRQPFEAAGAALACSDLLFQDQKSLAAGTPSALATLETRAD